MATDNKKIKDPADAALSAIEQALNLDKTLGPDEFAASDRSAGRGAPATDEAQAAGDPPRLPDVDDHDFTSAPAGSLVPDAVPPPPPPSEERAADLDDGHDARPAFVAPDRAAVANDDRQSVGLMLQALQVRPSRGPYLLATLLTLLWAGGFGALLFAQGLTTPAAVLSAYTTTQIAVGALVVAGPILFFYIAAMLAVRSQEMRLVARAIGEVAVRLAQPETFSTDAVMSVSQAVRREVAAVGDGVERALARAGELETLVRSEISTLERAYADNEVRIRSLVDELVAQREAIITNADRVRAAMVGSHQSLTQDLDAAAERMVAAVNRAGDRVTGGLEERGQHITVALDQAGERMIEEMAGRGAELVDRLSLTSDEIRTGIAEVGTTITASLEGKVQDITAAFQRTGDMLNHRLQDGAGQVTRTLAETGRGVIDALAQQ
ncbi:MAG: hypothetical protein M3158_09805, partial [Pseudomonadota bacterium]|nr:hypothetical protein [Pseudomonadota bacterium]